MKQKIRVIRKRIKRKPYFILNVYVILVLMSLLVVSSYTWFTMSRTPRVTDMNVYITSTSGLKLSADPYLPEDQWQLQLDFWETESVPISLRPVTWSDQQERFWAAAYGADGRLLPTDTWHALRDSWNANNPGLDGYYMKATFYARCGMLTDVTLAPAMLVDERGTQGAGTYVIGVASWDLEGLLHLNSGKGAESSIRIGLRTTPMALTTDGTLVETGDRGGMVIYEPNADRHVGGSTGYIPTPSIDGTPTLVEEERLILQEATTWSDLDPVEIENIKLSPGDFYDDPIPSLFTVAPGEIVRIEMYIWLEGQDVDCTNLMNGAQLIANLQFTGQSQGQTGMVAIPTEEE